MTDIDKIVERQREEDRAREEHFSLKEKIGYTIGGVVVFFGTFFLGRRLIRKGVANNEEKKTFDEGNAATYAKQIKMAFENDGWPGTDTPKLRSTLREFPTQSAFVEVGKAYAQLYSANLTDDLKGELEFWEYPDNMAIITNKPK